MPLDTAGFSCQQNVDCEDKNWAFGGKTGFVGGESAANEGAVRTNGRNGGIVVVVLVSRFRLENHESVAGRHPSWVFPTPNVGMVPRLGDKTQRDFRGGSCCCKSIEGMGLGLNACWGEVAFQQHLFFFDS